MAVVGEAQIIVRAIGTSVKADIKNIFDGLDSVGGTSGKNLGEKFSQGFNKSGANNAVSKLADGLRKMNPEAERAREAWQKLTKTGYVLGPTITGLIGTISALIGSLVSIVGAAGAAGASLVVLGNVVSAMGLAMLSAKIALGGVMQALGAMGKGGGGAAKATDAVRRAQERLALVIEQNNEAIIEANNRITDAQLNLNDALEAGREELQQLGFAAEEAALAQQGAALDLERAREELARVQDLPPNSRIRREAELAFAQAELQYRQALDANADIAAEQERYVESGVEGTQDVIDARRELAEAEADLARTVRDGLRAQLEAERALAEARKSATAGGGADPFEGLTKSQKEFVKEMYKLKPLFDAVQEQVAKAFLPLLGGAVTDFANNVLPLVGAGLATIANQLGLAAVRFVNFLQSAEGMELIYKFFDNSAKLIGPMADAFGLLLQIFIRLMNAAAPVAERFVNWIVEGFEKFNNYLKDLDRDGSLTQFFQDAGDAAAEFGDLFGEVFRLIGQIIGANLGDGSPGREMVVWLTDGLRAANDLRDGIGASGLKDYFAAVNENVKPMLQFFGDMGKILIDMGANPAVGQVFEILRQAEPSIRKIAMALLEAAPSLAELVVQILRVLAAFTDTGQVTAFFDTLTKITTAVADVVEQAWFQKLLEQIGPLLSTFLALQTAFSVAKFAFNVLLGSLIGIVSAVGGAIGAVMGFMKVVDLAKAAVVFFGGGIRGLMFLLGGGGLLGIIIASIAGFVKFVASNTALKGIIDSIVSSVGRMVSALGTILKPIFDLFRLIGDAIGMVFGAAFIIALGIISGLFEVIAGVLEAIAESLQPLVDGFSAFVDAFEGVLGMNGPTKELATNVDDVKTATTNATPAISGMGDASDTATGQVTGLAKGVSTLEERTVTAITGNLDFMDSVDSLTNSLKDSGATSLYAEDSTGRLTDASRDAQRALLAGAQAVKDKMQADIDAEVPLETARELYRENYENLKKTAINAGLAADEVDAFVKSVLGANLENVIELKINTDNAQKKLNDFIRRNGGTPAFIGRAGSGIQAAGGLQDHIKGVSFATGGISEGIYRSMARPLIKFAEPETGWEAFISGRKGSEERNRGIVREAASRLGMNMGGVSITVNPSPGMDERALAGAVSQEITKLMRKGSIY